MHLSELGNSKTLLRPARHTLFPSRPPPLRVVLFQGGKAELVHSDHEVIGMAEPTGPLNSHPSLSSISPVSCGRVPGRVERWIASDARK
jgi:hypothetical protein